MAIQFDGRSLTPDIVGEFTRGQQSTQTLQNQRLAGQRQQQLIDQTKSQALGSKQASAQAAQTGQLAGQVVGGQLPEGVTRQQAIGQIFAQNPELAEKTLSSLGVQDQAAADEFSNFAFNLQNTPFAQRSGKIQQRALDLQSQGRDPKHTLDLANLNEDQQNKVAETIQLASLTTKERFEARPAPVKLSSVQQKIAAEGIDPNSPAGFKRAREINQGTQTAAVEIPNVLLTGLSEQVAEQGAAAFSAAGGGKDGLTAFQKIVDAGTEQEKRIASPQMLKSIFPQASKAETVQLQAAMDAAKTTEAGLKDAGKIRVEQQRLKKASGFQTRAVDLLNNILDNPEINDVIGSIEGSDESVLPFGGTKLRSDGEANAISDIKEAVDILTADNLSLMTGVLSETDIQIIKNLAGGALNRLRSEGRFIEDVTKLRDKLSSKLVQTADDTAKDRSVGSELQEGQIINNKQTGQRLQVVNGQLVEVQ